LILKLWRLEMARRTSTPKDGAVADDAPKAARQVTVTEQEIARRAYELYLSRGREDGGDLDDWLQAERELRTGLSSTRA
jgi:Protein of unknown function (DUF2934)